MKYQVYYLGSKCKVSTAGSVCILNMKKRNNNGKFASYISSMAEPTIEVSNDIVTMYFEPIPVAIATEIVAEQRLKFQVVRHKANSSHTNKINFPYEFEFHTYWNHGQYNEK